MGLFNLFNNNTALEQELDEAREKIKKLQAELLEAKETIVKLQQELGSQNHGDKPRNKPNKENKKQENAPKQDRQPKQNKPAQNNKPVSKEVQSENVQKQDKTKKSQQLWALMNVKTMMRLNLKRKSLIEEEKRNQTITQIRNQHSKLIPFSIIIVSMNSSRNIKNLYLKIPTVQIFIGISSWLY